MAIKRYAGDRFVGLSSDIKPTDIEDGAIFYEENTLKQYQLISSVWTEIISATTNFNTSLYITGTNIDSASQTTGVLNRGLRLDAGEGFSIYGNRDFFGSFQDAIIFQMEDGNAASGTTDGGFVFRGFSPTANFPVANNWMTVRSPGRVGINKMIPTYSLDVFGNAYIQSGAVFAGGFVAEANSTIESDLQVDNNLTVLQRLGISGNLNANLIPTGTVIFADASKNLTGISHFSYIRMGQTGFFGINTPNPTQSLDVSGRVRIRGGSPDSGKVLVSVDSSGNAIWENASNLVSGDFSTIANNLTLTGITLWNRDLSISGGLESRIFQTGAAAITFANGIGTNLSGNLTQTGITLWNRDAAISGGIETRIFTSGAAAVAYAASYANGIGSNLSGNLTQTGITLWNRDASISGGLESRIFSTGAAAVTFATSYTNSVGTSLSGNLTQTGAVLFARDAAISGGLESRIFSTGAAAITFSTSYANTVGTNLSGNLTQTGATLFARDASISGGLEARIFSTGAAAITFATSYANGVGTNLSGNLTSTGSILHNRIIALSGFLTGNYVDGGGTANYIPRWGDFNTLNDSAIYQNGSSISIGWTGGIAPLDILGNINIRTGYINLINGDINFQQGEHLGSSSTEYIGPAGLIDLIHVLGNGIGVNDPIRFRPIYNKECYSGGVWIPDPNSGIISYERLIDNAAYAPVGILTQMETSVGISGKRFTLDLQNTYIRPNIITMSKGWNQSHWEYTPIIESGASTSSFNVIVSGSNLTRSNGAGTKLFYLGNVNEARYLRFSFLSTEHINTGNLSIGKIRGYGNQYSSSVTIQPLQVDSGRNVFISNKLNIGDTSIRSAALNVGTSSTSASQGLSFGADSTANLYRSAASTVKTDGYFVSEAGITSNGVIFANDDIECIANISSNYLDVTQNIQTNDINVSRSGTFSGIRISGGSPALGKVLSSIDSFGNTVWSNATSLPGIVSSGFITGISGFLSNIIANTGQQAWQTANNNSINLSGNLTQTGITLWNRDAAISGGLEARINATGAATVAFATSYANAIGVNLSGNLTQTGITLWNRDTAISGGLESRIFSTGAAAVTFATSHANGIGINLSGNLTQTGATLFARDAAISGGLESRIFTSGAAAINYASSYSNGIGVNLSGNLTQTGITLLNRDIAISGGIESRIFSTGAASIAFATSYANAIGTNLSGNLTQTGITLWNRDASISGGLEARITATGTATILHSNGIGVNLSGNLTQSGIILNNRINALSGFLTGNYIDGNGSSNYLARWSDTNTLTNSAFFQNGSNVSLGHTNPTSILDISGILNIRGDINLINSDISFQRGENLSFSAAEYTGPVGLIDLIHVVSNGVGVNDPIRFRPIYNKECYSGGLWIPDPNSGVMDYERLIDNSATNTVYILSSGEAGSGISGKRFTLDLQNTYIRPNIITMSKGWDQHTWDYTPVIESGNTLTTFGVMSSGSSLTRSNGAGTRLFYFSDIGEARYLRFSFFSTEHINSGNLRLSKIRGYGNQYSRLVTIQPLQIDSGRNVFISNKLNVGDTGIRSAALNVGSLSTSSTQGLSFGTDTTANLYRSAASTVKTDGYFISEAGITSNGVIFANDDIECIANVSANYLDITQSIQANDINVSRSGTFSGIRISGGSPSAGRVLQSIDSLGNASWTDVTSLAGIVSSGFITGISGHLNSLISATGQQAWTAANNNAVNLSGNLTQTGIVLFNRDVAISGGLESRIFSTGAAAITFAISYANGIGANLSGNLTQTGLTLFNRDAAISGGLEARIFATGSAAVSFATSYSNGIGINLSGNLTQTGATLFARDAAISGGLESRIFSTGSASINYSNSIGVSTSGSIHNSGQLLNNKIDSLSGTYTGTPTYFPRWTADNKFVNSSIFENADRSISITGNPNVSVNIQPFVQLTANTNVDGRGLFRILNNHGNHTSAASAAGLSLVSFSNVSTQPYASGHEAQILLSSRTTSQDGRLRIIAPRNIHFNTSAENVVMTGLPGYPNYGTETFVINSGYVSGINFITRGAITGRSLDLTNNLSVNGTSMFYNNIDILGDVTTDTLNAFLYVDTPLVIATSGTFSGLSIYGNSPQVDRILSSIDSNGTTLWRDASYFVTGLSGVLNAALQATGILLFNRDTSISGGLEARIFSTGSASITYANSIGVNLSGNLTDTGITLWNRDLSISGGLENRIFSTGAAAVIYATSYANGIGSNISGNLTQTGLTLWNRDASISGGLESRIFSTGAAAIAFASLYSNGIGSNISGNLTQTGITLWNRDLSISGGLETRIFSTGAAAIAFATNIGSGANLWTYSPSLNLIRSSGTAAVSIGTSSNGRGRLEILQRTNDITGGFSMTDTGITVSTRLFFDTGAHLNFYTSINQSNDLRLYTRYFGINKTTTPDAPLHIFNSNTNAPIVIESSGHNNPAGITFRRQRLSGPDVAGGSIFINGDTGSNFPALYIQSQSAGMNAGVTSPLTDDNGVRIIMATGLMLFENGTRRTLTLDKNGLRTEYNLSGNSITGLSVDVRSSLNIRTNTSTTDSILGASDSIGTAIWRPSSYFTAGPSGVLNGALQASGILLFNRDSAISGGLESRIFSTGAAGVAFTTSYANGVGISLSGNLTQTGITLWNRDAAISGGLESRIFTSGATAVTSAITYANGIGVNLSGNLTNTGSTLHNRIIALSGFLTGNYVDGNGTANYIPRWSDANTLTNSTIYQNGTSTSLGWIGGTSTLDISGTTNFRSGNITLIGADIGYQAGRTIRLGQSYGEYNGPQSLIDIIHALSNGVGVNDPLRFRPILSKDYYSGGVWYTDPAGPSFENCIDNRLTSVTQVISKEDCDVGISGKRFVLDLQGQYARPNFITISPAWDQASWGCIPVLEGSIDNITYSILSSGGETNRTASRIIGMYPGDIGANRYLRFSFLASEAITGASSSFSLSKIRSISNQQGQNRQPISIDSGRNIYFANRLNISGTSVVNSALNIGTSSLTTASNGLTFGEDLTANLYRSAAGTISTNASLDIAYGLTVGSFAQFNADVNVDALLVTYELEAMNVKATRSGIFSGIRISGGSPALGRVLQCNDAFGNATWSDPANLAGLSGANIWMQTGNILFPSGSSVMVGINTRNPAYNLQVNGSFAATTKSFDIPHPLDPSKRLIHGSLEGPEFGVYIRGKSTGQYINLPDYWEKLVDEETISVQLTPIGKNIVGRIRNYSVDKIEKDKIKIFTDSFDKIYNYYYNVYAERKDIPKINN